MRILLINQAFHPDVVSSGQHAADLASALAVEGHEVTVVAARRGYDDPSVRFRPSEHWRGVQIHRVWGSGLGKHAKWRRLIDAATFQISCLLRVLTLPRSDVIIAMTSPPLITVPAALLARFRHCRLVMWVMDLYPDAAIAAGWMRENAPITKALTQLFAYSLRSATEIVVLDTFMAARLREKNVPAHKLVIVPPWSHDEDVRYDFAGRSAFRERYGLTDKVVVMYAGNHNACHPLDTLLQAALALRTDNDIVFCFVGGGVRFGEVRRFVSEHRLTNVVFIPYQPLELLSAALSSADLHVVVMGNGLAGIVHPCKAYNILRLGIPFLYIGPTESHVTELVPPQAIGDWAYLTRHGDVEAVVNAIVNCRRIGGRLSEAERHVGRQFSGTTLLPLLTGLFEPVSETARETSTTPAATEPARCDAGGEPA